MHIQELPNNYHIDNNEEDDLRKTCRARNIQLRWVRTDFCRFKITPSDTIIE